MSYLEELKEVGMLVATLEQPVDSGLNTLLHFAVSKGCRDSARVLLAYGARLDLLNERGDTVLQWFMLP